MSPGKKKSDLVNIYLAEAVQLSPDEQREAPLFQPDARKVLWCTSAPVIKRDSVPITRTRERHLFFSSKDNRTVILT